MHLQLLQSTRQSISLIEILTNIVSSKFLKNEPTTTFTTTTAFYSNLLNLSPITLNTKYPELLNLAIPNITVRKLHVNTTTSVNGGG
jgi:hypothetical protein